MAAGSLTVTGKNEALDALVSTNGTLYMALLDGAVEETGAGAGGTPYARQAITWSAAAAGAKSNSAAVVFDNGGATDWGAALDSWGIYDALTSGNQLAAGALDNVRDLSNAGAKLTFDIGTVVITLTDLGA